MNISQDQKSDGKTRILAREIGRVLNVAEGEQVAGGYTETGDFPFPVTGTDTGNACDK